MQGRGSCVYRDYIQAINNYLIPFFDRYNVNNISYLLIRQFGVLAR